MINKVYYLSLKDYEYPPFTKINYVELLKEFLDDSYLSQHIVPSDITSNASIYNDLASLVYSKFRNLAIAKIIKPMNQEPNSDDLEEAWKEFQYRYLSLLNDTYELYITLLTNYSNAKASLMADITATSKNRVKFNDTPQNTNVSGTYEGDNYITHFTSTEGENSSPLMSKMMRLKEIQENYRDLMTEWANDFHRIFFEEEC